MSIKEWLNKIAKSFQPAYDKIKGLKLPKEIDNMLDLIWDNLSPALQNALWKFIENLIREYGEEKAREMLELIIPRMAKI